MQDIKHVKQNLHSVAWVMPQGWDLGVLGSNILAWGFMIAPHRLLILVFILCLSLPFCLICVLQPCGHLLGKGWPLGPPVCDVFLCICHFPVWCSGSGVMLDCIDS